MHRQLDQIIKGIEMDIEAGPGSRCRIGIVPISRIGPLPDVLPAGMSLTVPRDIRMVETGDSGYIMGQDDFEVDRIGETGIRRSEVMRRQAALREWAGLAVYGEAALVLVEESRAALPV